MNSFTAHNLLLPDGSRTMPEQSHLLADIPWFKSVKRTLKMVYQGRLNGRSVVDLGCLEGGYAAEFARLGMEATGIEVRQSNFENCLYVKDKLGLPNLSFFKDDVLHLERYGQFDIVFCNGLLYHLENPRSFVSLMGRCTKDVVIINTHYAPKGNSEVFALSPTTRHEGLPGRWYAEHELDPVSHRAELEALKWASWANRRSFWPTREALAQCIQEAGFDIIFEPLDWAGNDMLHGVVEQERFNRIMLVGVRGG